MKFLRNGGIELLILGILLILDAVLGYNTVVHVSPLLFAYAVWIQVLLVLVILLEEPFMLSLSIGQLNEHEFKKDAWRIKLYCIVLIPVFLIELFSLTISNHTVLGAWNTRGLPVYQPVPISEYKGLPSIDGKYPGQIAYFDSLNRELKALAFDSDLYVWMQVKDGRLIQIEIPYYTYFVSEGSGTEEADRFWQQLRQLRYVRVLSCPYLDSIPISQSEFLGNPEESVLEPHSIYVR